MNKNTNNYKLISDSPIWDCELVVEQTNSGKPKQLKIVGPFLVANRRNGNGRLYTSDVLDKSVNEYTAERINKGLSFGETNHPDTIDVNYERACIKVDSFVRENDIWIGSATVLASFPEHGIRGTILGDNLASILQYGGKPGISSRGVGKIGANKTIDEIYKLIAMDVVHNPSGPGCYVDGILESKNFMIDIHGNILESAFDEFERKMNNLPLKATFKADHILQSFNNFYNALSKM